MTPLEKIFLGYHPSIGHLGDKNSDNQRYNIKLARGLALLKKGLKMCHSEEVKKPSKRNGDLLKQITG
jgi:hypothetical protein